MARIPVDEPYTITTHFDDPDTNALFGRHSGDDYAVETGRPVKAPINGTVVYAQLHPIRGNMVGIFDGENTHRLMHNSRFNVTVGQKVTEGDVVAFAGTTGLSTGPHCHWDIIRGNKMDATSFDDFINPDTWLTSKGVTMSPEAVNLAFAAALNRQATDEEKKAYTGKSPEFVLQTIYNNNADYRTKAANFDQFASALQDARNQLSNLKSAPSAVKQVVTDMEAVIVKYKQEG